MLLSGEAVHLDKGNTHVKLDEESVRRLGKDPTEVDVLAGFNTSQARYVEDGDKVDLLYEGVWKMEKGLKGPCNGAPPSYRGIRAEYFYLFGTVREVVLTQRRVRVEPEPFVI